VLGVKKKLVTSTLPHYNCIKNAGRLTLLVDVQLLHSYLRHAHLRLHVLTDGIVRSFHVSNGFLFIAALVKITFYILCMIEGDIHRGLDVAVVVEILSCVNASDDVSFCNRLSD
jgi:hypothetical protein